MGKALANGYPISVLMGTPELKKTASSFFITGTYWMSAVPMVAAMATSTRPSGWEARPASRRSVRSSKPAWRPRGTRRASPPG